MLLILLHQNLTGIISQAIKALQWPSMLGTHIHDSLCLQQRGGVHRNLLHAATHIRRGFPVQIEIEMGK